MERNTRRNFGRTANWYGATAGSKGSAHAFKVPLADHSNLQPDIDLRFQENLGTFSAGGMVVTATSGVADLDSLNQTFGLKTMLVDGANIRLCLSNLVNPKPAAA